MGSTIQIEQFVDANTVAAHVKVTRRQVLEMTRRGVIPGYSLGIGSKRKAWRYKLSEIDAVVTGGSKNKLERAVGPSVFPSTMSSGSPRSQKGKF